MNQGKMEVVKQEMARVNVDILEISELKWTGMDEFNSDDYYIYYYRQEEYNQSDFSVYLLVMSMCRVFSCVVGRGCLL